MSSILNVLSNAIQGFHDGVVRLKEGLWSFFLLIRPRQRMKCPPHVRGVDDLGERVIDIAASSAVACPTVLPMVTPSVQECRTRELNGARSARALFLDPFVPLSPMGVFEISSNACSPSTEESITVTSSVTDMQSPLSSSGNESQCTAMFDTFNSPSLSTAPTTPASSIFYPGHPVVIEGECDGAHEDTSCEDDNVPLSELMIHRSTGGKAYKRNGISGNLLENRNAVPLWASAVKSSRSGHPDSGVAEQRVEVDIADAAHASAVEYTHLEQHTVEASNRDVDLRAGQLDIGAILAERPVNPLSWCEAWVPTITSPWADDESVYSCDSFVPASASPARNHRMSITPQIVPDITLTPPSLPTSPDVTPSNTAEDVPLASQITTETDDIGSPDCGHFKATNLLVPLHWPIPRHSIDPFAQGGNDGEDESLVKRRRRNACRLNTSSIDIIMAGLDQEFPDTPITSPVTSPSEFPDNLLRVHPGIDLQTEGAEKDSIPAFSMLYPPSSPSTTIRDSVGDMSGETLFFEEDPASKFSDSSDEEQDPDLLKAVGKLEHSRLSWPISQMPFFGTSSVLSTIVEEEEDGSRGALSLGSKLDTLPILDPPAVIGGPDCVSYKATLTCPPAGKVSKKRWFSMIEDNSARPASVKSARRKHMSAPALTLSRPRPHPRLGSSGSNATNSRILSRSRSSTIQEIAARPRSLIRLPVLPNQVSTRSAIVPEESREIDNTRGSLVRPASADSDEFSLPSTRSSSCISLYQRPWSLYIPADPVEGLQRDLAASPSSSPATSRSVDEPILPPANDVQQDGEPLSLGDTSPTRGLDGILAILDTMDILATPTAYYPDDGADSSTDPYSPDPDSGVVRWSYTDFDAYFSDSVGSEFFAGVAV